MTLMAFPPTVLHFTRSHRGVAAVPFLRQPLRLRSRDGALHTESVCRSPFVSENAAGRLCRFLKCQKPSFIFRISYCLGAKSMRPNSCNVTPVCFLTSPGFRTVPVSKWHYPGDIRELKRVDGASRAA
ncbi:hypothetical protein SKAU_G00262600 [Synaphobranchus kaupii]|uniref:Uncharacterized protein n=1 Tax=Synaphobranchus kaupii TaxID=118154 RepID=A0A9Q1IPS2_SYNKA|nr:hypothetical protein SKAU_G00262600 [Synaphobranchus kaupii]